LSTVARVKLFKRSFACTAACLFLFTSQSPAETGRDMERFRHVIASYTTSIAHQESSVQRNIALASESLNGTVISPGQTFSFNSVVGEGSAERGYLTGRVLYRDSTAYEEGGGICQVSSTLFNALLLSGVIIKERHRHYQPVSYVPLGLDATIKYGKKDLKVRNPYSFNLFIFTEISGGSLTVTVKSGSSLPYRYEISTEEEEVNLPLNTDENIRIRPGLSIIVYRQKYSGTKLLGSYLLYKDFYPPARME